MPTDLVKRLDLGLFYPPFLDALLEVLAACRAKGVDYKVYSGFRSFEEQHKLYQAFLAGGSRAASPGRSAHNFGLAADCARLLPSGKLSWEHKDYEVLLDVLPVHGLKSGAPYNDKPHINWPNYEGATQLRPLDKLFRTTPGSLQDRLKVVWRYLDEH